MRDDDGDNGILRELLLDAWSLAIEMLAAPAGQGTAPGSDLEDDKSLAMSALDGGRELLATGSS